MLTHGSHMVDMARLLGGEMVAVQARLVEKFGAYCWFALSISPTERLATWI